MAAHARKASRGGRYRKQLVDPEAFQPYALALQTFFHKLNALRESRTLADAEFAGYVLLTLLVCRRNDALQPFGSAAKAPSEWNQTQLKGSEPFSPFLFLPLWRDAGLPVQSDHLPWERSPSLLSFLSQIRFRGIPDSARLALTEWLRGHYPLTLFFHIPPAETVFEMQKSGGRCITLFMHAHELVQMHHGRDALSFFIHDLIHAHEFYSDPVRAKQQIGFYHWLESLRGQPQIQALLQQSPSFQARWDYVLADMNSYCGHLLKTLHAAFIQEIPNGEGQKDWATAVNNSELSGSQKQLFLKVNSSEWGATEFLALEQVLAEKAEQKGK
jgi:hypothetical protein